MSECSVNAIRIHNLLRKELKEINEQYSSKVEDFKEGRKNLVEAIAKAQLGKLQSIFEENKDSLQTLAAKLKEALDDSSSPLQAALNKAVKGELLLKFGNGVFFGSPREFTILNAVTVNKGKNKITRITVTENSAKNSKILELDFNLVDNNLVSTTKVSRGGGSVAIDGSQSILPEVVRSHLRNSTSETQDNLRRVASIADNLVTLDNELLDISMDINKLELKLEEESLGSMPSDDDIKSLIEFAKVDEFTTTKEGLIKSLEALYALGKHKVADSVMEHYRKVLDNTNPEFFRKVNLYLKNTTKETMGVFNASTGDIAIKVSNSLNTIYQTPAEVYMHELVHAFTYWGLRVKSLEARKVQRELRYAQMQALKHTKIEDLLTVDSKAATKEDWKRATELHKYLFSGSTSLDEFTAYAITNPAFIKHLSKVRLKKEEATTIFEKISAAFNTILDVVMGNYKFNEKDNSIQEQVMQLALQLGTINGNAAAKAIKMNPVSTISGVLEGGLDFLDDKTARAMHKVGEVIDSDGKLRPYPDDASSLQRGIWGIKFATKAILNKTYRDTVLVWASSLWGGMKPEGDLRQFGSDLFPEDEGKSLGTWLNLHSNRIDSVRNSTAYQVINDVKNAFNRPISDYQEEAITAVLLDTNAGHLVYTKEGRKGINNGRLVDLISSDDKLAYAKKLVQNKIVKHLTEDKQGNALKGATSRANIVKELSMLLGIHMATGKVTEATVFNSKGIVLGHGTQGRFKYDATLDAMVKELASIWALENVSREHKDTVVDLLHNERRGVYQVMDMFEGFIHASRKELFDGDDIHMIAGYTKELFEPSINMQVRKLSEKEEMEDKGYKFAGEVKIRASGQRDRMGYFVSSTHAKAERLKGATPLGQLSARGTSITEINYMDSPTLGKSYSDRDIAVANAKAANMVASMAAGKFDLGKVEWGMAKVVDATGKVVDYRVMMNKDMKKKLLKQDTRVSEVLGWSVASIHNKVMTELHTDQVLDVIKLGMQEWHGGELGGDTGFVEYDLIGPNAADPEMKELFYMLPKKFRDFIEVRSDKTMAVRRDLRLIMFGYKHPKLSNLWGINNLGPVAIEVIDRFESLWFDLVSLAKGAILLKMPWVITTNIVSNLMQVITMGVGITEAVALHGESLRDVRQFIKDSREKLTLELAINRLRSNLYRVENRHSIKREYDDAKAQLATKIEQHKLAVDGSNLQVRVEKEIVELEERLVELTKLNNTNGDKIEREIEWMSNKVSTLEEGLRDNPVRGLVDAGLMQALVEDVNTASAGDTNTITKWVDDLMQNAPGVIRDAGSIMYLTQNTTWYKVMQETLQLSDLVARDVLNRKLMSVEYDRATGIRDYQPEMVKIMKEQYGLSLVNGIPLSDTNSTRKGIVTVDGRKVALGGAVNINGIAQPVKSDLELYLEVVKAYRMQLLKNRFINYAQPNGRYEEWANKAGILMFTKYFKRIQREIFAISGDHPVRAAIGALIATTGLDTVQGQSFILKGDGFDGSFGLSNLMPLHSPIDVALTVINPPLIRLGMAAID